MTVASRRHLTAPDEARMPLPAAWAGVVPVPENRSAVRAARRLAARVIAGRPTASAFAPLVLHGLPGTGKTLVAAAAVRAVTDAPDGRTARLVAARDLGRPDDDSADDADLRAADLLVVEDVQHLPPAAADVLGRLLDARAARRRPTVVTADAGPAGLTALPRRLTSRLTAGLVVPLEPLAAASRRRVLVRLAKRRGVPLAPDAVAWLADRSTGGGVRPLVGAVETLRAAGAAAGPLDRAAVEALLAEPSGPAPVERIVGRVAAAFGVTAKDVLGPSRLRAVLVPRQVAMYLAREVARLPLVRVGELFGGRNHTTVLHAVRKVEAAVAADATLAGTVRRLRAELG
jgi:chromosomal replication initiator protein